MKRFIALAIIFVLLISAFPVSAFAVTTPKNETPGKLKAGKTQESTNFAPPDNKKATNNSSQKKLSTTLLQLTDDEYLPKGKTRNQLIQQMKKQKQISEPPQKRGQNNDKPVTRVYVYIQLKKGVDLSILDPFVLEVINKDKKENLVSAWVDINRLNELAAAEGVKSLREVTQPRPKVGSVTTEGDSVLRADLARTQGSTQGSGVKIGVISDGVNNRSSAIASGDLPSSLTVLSDTQGGDEGTAMLEIIHDLAPGAQLYFHDCGSDVLGFNAAIDDLVSAGCSIICDDIGWYNEPYFEDGIIGGHVKDIVTANNVLFVSAAGNDADCHYQGMFYNNGSGYHDFSRGSEAQKYLYADIPDGGTIYVFLQWNEPFGAASSDYDMYLEERNTGTVIYGSEDSQDGSQDPFEVFAYTNDTGADLQTRIMVYDYNAPVPKTLELFVWTYDGATLYSNNLTSSDSIFGHPAVPGVVACGAANASTPNDIEYFSSQGPVTLLSGTRQKPDIVGADRVSVTGAGDFPSLFAGTSAAAPHVAAIAALLKSRFPNKSPSDIKNIITGNGIDLGTAGYDNIYGYGRADALNAALSSVYVSFDSQHGSAVNRVLAVKNSSISPPSPPSRDGFSFGGWYKEASCSNPWNFAADKVNADTTLYAKWNLVSVLNNRAIEWQKSFGGSQNDFGQSMVATPDGGYVVAGNTASGDGDVAGYHPGVGPSSDAWIVKLNSAGSIVWQKCIGGTSGDVFDDIKPTSDGGYIALGISSSADGDLAGIAAGDTWIVKLDSSGNVQWQKRFNINISDDQNLTKEILTANDGGYFISSDSLNGNIGDICITKIDSGGNYDWQKKYGGSQDEFFDSTVNTSDGGLIIAATTKSNDGDVTGNHGDSDAWFLKLNPDGSIGWQKCFGDTGTGFGFSAIPVSDGYLVTCKYSNDASSKARLMKLNMSGDIQWEQQLEGNGASYLISTSSGGYAYVSGDSNYSHPGRWITELDSSFNIIGQARFNTETEIETLKKTSEGGYVFTAVPSGDDIGATGNHGRLDMWIVKVKPMASVSGITLNKTKLDIQTGGNYTITATVSPSNATNQVISWESSNSSVASVQYTDAAYQEHKTASIHSASEGTATITARSEYGNIIGQCSVAVYNKLPTSIQLDKTSAFIPLGNSLRLIATVKPDDASNKNVIWQSSDTGVATVSDGLVEVHSAGTAVITATTEAGGFTAQCSIMAGNVLPVGLSTSKSDVTTYGGSNGTITLTASGGNSGTYEYTLSGVTGWQGSGYFSGLRAGTYSVSARDALNKTNMATSSVSIGEASFSQVGISATKTDATTYGGSNGTITLSAEGGNSGTYEYTINGVTGWQASGYFSGFRAGTYAVTVRDTGNWNNTASTSITIRQPAYAGTYPANKTPTKANSGTAFVISPPAPPRGYTTQSVSYSSSNPSIASVDQNGSLTFLAGGKVRVTISTVIRTVDRKGRVILKTKKTTKTITVKQPVSSIALSSTETRIARTQRIKLTPYIYPGTASNKKVKWTSSNSRIASVSSSGVVTGKAGGTAIITCRSTDGSNVSASCVVNVTPIYPTGIRLSKGALSIKLGKTSSLKATILPKNTDFKTITWTSGNTSIATVDGKGRIRGISIGTVTITATTTNGYSASCAVTIK